MKTKSLLWAAMIVVMAACTSHKEPQFNIKVNLANADGQTVYLQRNGQVLDSAVIQNWDAEFNTPIRTDNEMYAIMLKQWRRPVSFFTDNKDLYLEGDAQNPNNIAIKGSETQARLDAFTEGFNVLDAKLDSIGQQLQEAKDAGNLELAEQLKQQYEDAEEIQKMSEQEFRDAIEDSIEMAKKRIKSYESWRPEYLASVRWLPYNRYA